MNRKELLAKAEELGLNVPKNISTDKLVLMIEDLEAGKEVITGVPTGEREPTLEELRKQLEEEYQEKLNRKLTELEEINAINESTLATKKAGGQHKLSKIKEAKKLVRVVVTNRNPLKQAWEGEIIAASNDMGVDEKKYVPFSLDAGYYLPQIIVNTLKDKKCTIFVNKKGRDGKMLNKAKLIKEYGIEVLPDLTQEELDKLAADQRARGATADED